MKQIQSELTHKQQRTQRLHPLLYLLPLLMVSVWVGCKPEAKPTADTTSVGTAAADINPVGTYNLVSVDGKKVPCTLQHEGQSPTINSGVFTINADRTCSSKVDFSLPSGGKTSREVKATYTREGSKLTMKWEGAGMTTGTIEGDTFTMNNEGMIFAYRK
jgi:hypothetical protein